MRRFWTGLRSDACTGGGCRLGNLSLSVEIEGVTRLVIRQVGVVAAGAAVLLAISGHIFAGEFPRIVAVRVSGQERRGDKLVQVSAGGSAVEVGSGRYVTASHIVEGLRSFAVELEINGKWMRGRISTVDDRDAAVVTCDDESGGSPVPLAEPQYGQRVTVVGFKTGAPQRGTVSDTRTVSLDLECAGIQQGDSGGGIFTDDGALVGIISARNPNEPRVVYFTHAEAVSQLIPRREVAPDRSRLQRFGAE